MSLPQLSGLEQVLLNVSNGKVDLSFEEPAIAKALPCQKPKELVFRLIRIEVVKFSGILDR